MVSNLQARSPDGGQPPSQRSGENIFSLGLRYLALAVFNAMALIIIYAFLGDDNIGLAVVFGIITLFTNIVTLVPGLYPIRWMAPGLMLMILFVIYPIVYTVYTAFTNYGDGHLLTKDQALVLIERQQFVPEDAQTYSWDLYQNDAGSYALWLSTSDETGNLVVAFAPVGNPIVELDDPPSEPPEYYEDYRLLSAGERTQALTTLQDTVFGVDDDDTAAVANRRQAARPLVQRFEYDAEQDFVLDQQSDSRYIADNAAGVFRLENGSDADVLSPGYRVTIGLTNFQKLYEDRTLLEPLINVFVWTIVFSLVTVLITFAFGLLMALVMDHPFVPFRKFWRSLIFIPYAIPGVISVLVWKGLLNENIGLVTNAILELTGYRVPWFSDPWMAKAAIFLVNLWLGYPYMMLICSGAIQAIPKSVYEAAAIDGAQGLQTFWNITLPMLLISVGPLLVASFTYNFNNYLLIDLLTGGNPPMAGTPTPAGYTDLLINYTYNLAFGTGTGADYGYAAAITIVIFAIVALITLFNFRFVAGWEEIGENV